MGTATKEKVQSVRLTEDMRREIVSALLTHKLAKREADYAAGEYKIAQRVYQHVFSASDRRKMEELPKGWLPTVEYLRVKLGDDWRYFHFGPQPKNGRRESRLVTQKFSDDRAVVLEVRSDIGVAVRDYMEAGVALVKERQELETKARGVISNVTTTTRLAEVWPEVVPFIPKYVPRLLPVVRRDELNAAFGLKASAA